MADAKVIESWWRFYDGQMTHARHHETLRSQSTTVIITVSLGVIAYIAKGNISNSDEATVWMFVALLNFFGFLISLAHTVRNRIHIAVAMKVREAINPHILLDGESLRNLRNRTHGAAVLQLRAFSSWLWPVIHVAMLAIALYYFFSVT